MSIHEFEVLVDVTLWSYNGCNFLVGHSWLWQSYVFLELGVYEEAYKRWRRTVCQTFQGVVNLFIWGCLVSLVNAVIVLGSKLRHCTDNRHFVLVAFDAEKRICIRFKSILCARVRHFSNVWKHSSVLGLDHVY